MTYGRLDLSKIVQIPNKRRGKNKEDLYSAGAALVRKWLREYEEQHFPATVQKHKPAYDPPRDKDSNQGRS